MAFTTPAHHLDLRKPGIATLPWAPPPISHPGPSRAGPSGDSDRPAGHDEGRIPPELMMPTPPANLSAALALLLLGGDRATAANWDPASVRLHLLALADPGPGQKPPRPSAMCYKPAPPLQEQAEYLCPRCLASTRYTRPRSDATGEFLWLYELIHGQELARFRQRVADLPGRFATLDESPLCAQCGGHDPRPGVTLVLTWPDGSSTHTPKLHGEDLDLLEGLLKHRPPFRNPASIPAALSAHQPLRFKVLLGQP